MGKVSKAIIYTLVLVAVLIVYSGESHAAGVSLIQKNELALQIDGAKGVVFYDALHLISNRAKIAIVADGVPLHPFLSQQDAQSFTDKLLPLPLLITKLADAFDYDAILKGNTLQLKKRYSDPTDVPSITLEEGAQTALDLKRILSRFNPHLTSGQSSIPQGLLKTLNPEQLKAMEEETLSVSALTGEQRSLAWSTALYFYVQVPEEGTESLSKIFARVLKKESVLCWEGQKDISNLGIRSPSTVAWEPPFIPLGSSPASHSISAVGKLLSDFDSQAKQTPDVFTIGSIITKLVATSDASLPSISVDPMLLEKIVIVVEPEVVKPEVVVEAIAAVYGLRVVVDRKDNNQVRIQLTRRYAKLPETLEQLPEAVLNVLPDPMIRAFHLQPDVNALVSNTSEQNISGTPSVKGNANRNIKYRTMVALKVMYTDVMPKLDKTNEGRIVLSNLSRTEKSLIANILIGSRLNLQNVTVSPPYISNFERSYLVGGLRGNKGGRQVFIVMLATERPDKLRKKSSSTPASGSYQVPSTGLIPGGGAFVHPVN